MRTPIIGNAGQKLANLWQMLPLTVQVRCILQISPYLVQKESYFYQARWGEPFRQVIANAQPFAIPTKSQFEQAAERKMMLVEKHKAQDPQVPSRASTLTV
jgi:hypothetical protein